MSCSDSVNLVDEPDLSDDVAFRQPADLTLSDHVHRLISRDRVQRAADGPEPEAGSDSLLDETMVLFQDIILIRRQPAAAAPSQRPRLLQFRNGCGVGWMAVNVDHSGPNAPGSVQRQLQELLGRHQIPVGRQHEIDGVPVESTARYRYTQFPATRTYVSSTRQDRFGRRRSRPNRWFEIGA